MAQLLLDEVFMVLVCIERKNMAVFAYLVNEKRQYWSYQRFRLVLTMCVH